MRIRRYRPRSRSSSRRSWMSLMGWRPPAESVAPSAGVAGGDLRHVRGRAVGVGGRLALLAEPQLGGGIPEVRIGLGVDQMVDRRRGRLALEPSGAVVGPRVRAVVLLARDVETQLLEHAAVVLGLRAQR